MTSVLPAPGGVMRAVLRRGAILAGTLWCSTAPAWAFDVGQELSPHNMRTFAAAEGLPQSNVRALAQTPDGYLWIGTDGGLSRYDGHGFRTFGSGPTLDHVSSLLVAKNGDLWIGARGAGIARIANGVFSTFEKQLGKIVPPSAIFQDSRGRVWFGSWEGVVRHSEGQFVALPRPGGMDIHDILSIGEDAAGGMWFGTNDGLVRLFEDRSTRIAKLSGISMAPTRALLGDRDGSLWAGADSGDLLRYRDGAWSVIVDTQHGVGAIRGLRRDRAGNLWAATDGGLARLAGNRLVRAAPGSIVDEPSNTLLEDSEGDLWVGTRASGLIRLSTGAFNTVADRRLSGRIIKAVLAASDGSLWAGGEGGSLFRLRPDGDRRYPWPAGLCTPEILALAEDAHGQIWFGGERGRGAVLCRVNPVSGAVRAYTQADGLPEAVVGALMVQPDGVLVMSTYKGIYRMEDTVAGGVKHLPASEDMAIFGLHTDPSGSLWAGVGGGERAGLYRFDPDGTRRRFTEGLSNQLIYSIHADASGALWLGTLYGFSRYRDGKITGWKKKQGFLDISVYAVIPDAGNNLWLCSLDGIYRVAREAIDAYDRSGKPLTFTKYGASDGLATEQCENSVMSATKDATGRIWFATGKSVASIDPQVMGGPWTVHPPIIEGIWHDGRLVEGTALSRLPPGRGDIRITYTAPSLSRADKLRFRYQLVPFDADWVDANNERIASYTNVPPGQYVFRVAAGSDAAGVTTGLVATTTLVMQAHFYQELWFKIAIVLGLLAAIIAGAVLIHGRRIAVLKTKHMIVLVERTRIARDLHDTVAHGFTAISLQLEAANTWLRKREADRAEKNVNTARALVRESLADVRHAVWNLRPSAIGTSGLAGAVTKIASSMSAEVPVRVQINGQPRSLPDDYETFLLRIVQEAVTNAVRHSHATTISVEVTFLDDGLAIKVSDNGSGFDASALAPVGHHGLQGIRERAAEGGAEIDITSEPGKGTAVAVWAPFKHQARTGAS